MTGNYVQGAKRRGPVDKNGLTDWDRKNIKCMKEHGMTYAAWLDQRSMSKNASDEAYMKKCRESLGPDKPILSEDE